MLRLTSSNSTFAGLRSPWMTGIGRLWMWFKAITIPLSTFNNGSQSSSVIVSCYHINLGFQMACQWTYPYIGTHHNSQYEKSEGKCTGFVVALLKNQPRLHAYTLRTYDIVLALISLAVIISLIIFILAKG